MLDDKILSSLPAALQSPWTWGFIALLVLVMCVSQKTAMRLFGLAVLVGIAYLGWTHGQP